jgi:hypothetical protein
MDKEASRNLIGFIRAYTDLLEKQLEASRQTMQEAVDGVMSGIQQISDRTAQKKKEADTVLVATYTQPNDEQRRSMNEVQDEVAAVFEAAQASQLAKAKPVVPTAHDPELADKLRRNAGLFSKHMEALSTLDDDLQQLLLTMMGMLSRDDVVRQRIEHVAQGLQAMQMGLAYILVDYETRCRSADVTKLAEDMKAFTLRCYTMVEERQLFTQVFGDPKKKAS